LTAATAAGVYTGAITGGANNAFAGLTFVVAGFALSGNNGTFVCSSSTATTLTLVNGSASAETHSGTATASQSIWGIDQMLPVNAYYQVTGFTAVGQPAWGPNNQQVIGNGGTFDVGTWVPNLVISWTPPLQPLTLETNGVENAEQFVLNFEDTASITWVVDGNGNLEATATAVAIDLQTNSVDNSDQTKLNFEDTASVTWASTAGGVMKATATATAIDLQTDGVDNTDQAKLNLKSGTNITLTADGVGGTTVDGATQIADVETAGQGFLISSNIMIPSLFGATATAVNLVALANQVYAVQFVLPFKIKMTKASFIDAASASGAHLSFGIYDAAGTTKLVDTGVFTSSAVFAGNTLTFGSVTLNPGIYWFAWTTDNSGKNLEGIQFNSTAQFFSQFFNFVHPHYALAGNASTTGSLPSSLGTLTAQNTIISSAGIPLVLFEP
jgi:hypothetical protein